MNFLILEAVHIQGGESVANGWFFQRDGFRGAVLWICTLTPAPRNRPPPYFYSYNIKTAPPPIFYALTMIKGGSGLRGMGLVFIGDSFRGLFRVHQKKPFSVPPLKPPSVNHSGPVFFLIIETATPNMRPWFLCNNFLVTKTQLWVWGVKMPFYVSLPLLCRL